MDMDFLFLFIGLTLIASAFLQWNRKSHIRVITNVYLLLLSLVLIPISMIGAASAHRGMSAVEIIFPIIGVVLSILGIIYNSIKKNTIVESN